MANEEQLAILRQGVEVWNKWRANNQSLDIDLTEASLSRVELSKANLTGVNLLRANLKQAQLSSASLADTDLSRADLSFANLRGADLSGAALVDADLSDADLRYADLRAADLSKAALLHANLMGANFVQARLAGSKFSDARVYDTIFGNSSLSEAMGLEYVRHAGPSIISTSTFGLSNGKIPDVFLRGCGLSDWEIETVTLYNPDLSNDERNRILYKVYDLQASQAIQISPLFISYSHGDSEFVNKIGDSLAQKGIRYWRDIHDMKAGRLERQIDRAIRQNPTVLLILSKHSLASDWVEHEVRTARQLEKDIERDALCPVALDDTWKDSKWPKRLVEQIMEYNILDFSEWEDDVRFEGMFRKLIDGLELFYKG